MSIEVNGVTLPDIPSEVLEQYPYAVIIDASEASGAVAPYVFFCAESAFGVIPAELAGGAELLASLGPGYQGGYCWPDAEWTLGMSGTEGGIGNPINYEADPCYLMWANHDVCVVTQLNDDDTFLIGTEVYFPSSVSDPNYYAPKSWFDGMARQVMRLTGTSDKMNTDKMLELAKGVEVGGSLAENERIYQVGTAASTLDVSGLMTSSAS